MASCLLGAPPNRLGALKTATVIDEVSIGEIYCSRMVVSWSLLVRGSRRRGKMESVVDVKILRQERSSGRDGSGYS